MAIERNDHEDIYPGGPTYVRAAKTGNTLYISGTTAKNSNYENGSPLEQLRVILDRITNIVTTEGGSYEDIISMTTYVTDMRDFWPIEGEQKDIWQHYFNGVWPTNAYVEVSALAEPNLVVELSAIAIIE